MNKDLNEEGQGGETRDPDRFLAEANLEAPSQKKAGKLKIFFGYCPGVGKTYEMLKIAHEAKAAGQDIVIGYIEPHTRPDTMMLCKGLEILPKKLVEYRGLKVFEFDLDAALARRPEVILVDELAHTNVSGSRNKKRYQDVQELLNSGIDVYTTVNVQHLESLNDAVKEAVDIPVRETIPDFIFDDAEKVELVDIEPDELLRRFSDGKIYSPERAEQAKSNFFARRNLDTLRELSMRRTADRIYRDKTLKGEQNRQKSGESNILVLVSGSPSSAKNIRVASRMAESVHCKWTGLFVDTEGSSQHDKALKDNLALVDKLGGKIAVLYGDDVANIVAEYADMNGVTNIILGKSRRARRLRDLFHPALEDKLIVALKNVEVHIIPDNDIPNQKKYKATHVNGRLALAARVFAFLTVVLFIAALVNHFWFESAGVAGTVSAIIAAVAAAAAVFSVVAVTVSSRRRLKKAAARESRTKTLLDINSKLLSTRGLQHIIDLILTSCMRLFNRSAVFYQSSGGEGKTLYTETERDTLGTAQEGGVAAWCFSNGLPAGSGTDTLMGAAAFYIPIANNDLVLGVLGVSCTESGLSVDSRIFLRMLAPLFALALERQRLSDEQKENLLASIRK